MRDVPWVVMLSAQGMQRSSTRKVPPLERQCPSGRALTRAGLQGAVLGPSNPAQTQYLRYLRQGFFKQSLRLFSIALCWLLAAAAGAAGGSCAGRCGPRQHLPAQPGRLTAC